MGDSNNHCCENNVATVILIFRWTVSIFHCGRIVLPHLNTPMLMVWGNPSQAQHVLMTGIVRRQLPSLKSATWRNNGERAWNGSRFEHHIHLLHGERSRGEMRHVMLWSWLRPICRVLLSQCTQDCANNTFNSSAHSYTVTIDWLSKLITADNIWLHILDMDVYQLHACLYEASK